MNLRAADVGRDVLLAAEAVVILTTIRTRESQILPQTKPLPEDTLQRPNLRRLR